MRLASREVRGRRACAGRRRVPSHRERTHCGLRNTDKMDNYNPYIELEEARDDLNNILKEGNFFTLNLDIYFRAEILRGNLAFDRKIRALFEDIVFRQCKTDVYNVHSSVYCLQ